MYMTFREEIIKKLDLNRFYNNYLPTKLHNARIDLKRANRKKKIDKKLKAKKEIERLEYLISIK